MYSALLIVSSASAKGMQAVLTDDADRTTAFAWEGSYRTNRTIDQREICVQRRVRFASARLQTCKEISPLSQNYIRLKTGCPIIYQKIAKTGLSTSIARQGQDARNDARQAFLVALPGLAFGNQLIGNGLRRELRCRVIAQGAVVSRRRVAAQRDLPIAVSRCGRGGNHRIVEAGD